MLHHVTYKRNEKDFATKVVEDDANGNVTMYVDDKPVVTAETNELNGGISFLAGGVDINVRKYGQEISGLIAVLSDSIGRGYYDGDATPGINGSLITVNGNSWITYASLLSGQKIVNHKNASVIGNTMAAMRARVVDDVVNAIPKPGSCVVMSGYNDAYYDVSVADYIADMDYIVRHLMDAGISPIVGTPLPHGTHAGI